MKVKDLVQELQRFAAQDVRGGDAEFVLYDKDRDVELTMDPDTDVWEFEMTRDSGKFVIEF